MVKIKICGLKSPEDITYINKYQPEYIGFVFAISKRQLNDTQAAYLKELLDKKIQAVGVFVNEPMEHIIKLCRDKVIDMVQLHGDEDEDYILKLKNRISNPIIKAVRVQRAGQIEDMQKLSCNHLLLDTYSKNQFGGSGVTFDRGLIPDNCKPFFLAGGLNKDNIQEAIKDCSPYCVDISSGVETDGKKDEKKIMEIIELVRNVDHER
ncbi:MAG: phosphoribosylanthranilate isomerase [Anaerocolumna sp.]